MHPNDPRLHALRDALEGQVVRGSAGQLYHLRQRIGEGGQGWVFRAGWDGSPTFEVIVKVLRPDAVSADTSGRFQREAEVLRMLTAQPRPNPHIVRFFDHATLQLTIPGGTGEVVTLPFTVLELVNGPTLEQVLSSSKGFGLPVDRVRRLMRQIVLALEHVHAQRIVHRDLKPSNILLASDAGGESAKVTDFGLVKLVDVNLQRTTALAGASLGYAPPEQYEQGNQRVSARTDVFSLAAILFEMLTGKTAFPFREGENPLLIVTRILNGPRPSLARARESLPQDLHTRPDLVERLDVEIVRATSPDPGDRQESVTELWAVVNPVLRMAIEGTATLASARPAPIGEPPRSYSPAPSPPKRSSAPPGSGPRGSAVPTPSSSAPRVTRPPESRTAPMPAQQDARGALPSAWKWALKTRSIRPAAVRGASFAPKGDVALGVGPGGFARWTESEGWVALPLPAGVEARAVRGVRWTRGGVVFFGEGALSGRLKPAGGHEVWSVPDRDVTFLGAHWDEDGTTTLVGERPARPGAPRPPASSTIGMLAQLTDDGRLTLLSDANACVRLRAATRLVPSAQARSAALIACGDWGALVRLELGVAEHVGAVCGGHLTAMCATPDGGALVVGAGGHALSISPRLEAQLEAVQTTRDLLSLAISDDGVPWAGAAQARLLRRTNGSWVRMSGEVGVSAAVVAIWASAGVVRGVCDDGAIVEGTLT